MGAVGEWLGATLLGQGVSETIRHVSDTDAENCWVVPASALKDGGVRCRHAVSTRGAAVFLVASTFYKMPVSGTHAIVGGVVGMAVVGTSLPCVNELEWRCGGILGIGLSWVISSSHVRSTRCTDIHGDQ